MYNNFTRLTTEFTKSVNSLETCANELKILLNSIPTTQAEIIKKELELEKLTNNIQNIENLELAKRVKNLGNVMLSKPFYETLTGELEEYRHNFNNKVSKEIENARTKLQQELDYKLSLQKCLLEKEIAITQNELKFTKEKYEYISKINNIKIIENIEKQTTTQSTLPTSSQNNSPVATQTSSQNNTPDATQTSSQNTVQTTSLSHTTTEEKSYEPKRKLTPIIEEVLSD